MLLRICGCCYFSNLILVAIIGYRGMLLSLDYYVTDTDAILAVIFESFKKGMTLQIFLHYIYVVVVYSRWHTCLGMHFYSRMK